MFHMENTTMLNAITLPSKSAVLLPWLWVVFRVVTGTLVPRRKCPKLEFRYTPQDGVQTLALHARHSLKVVRGNYSIHLCCSPRALADSESNHSLL